MTKAAYIPIIYEFTCSACGRIEHRPVAMLPAGWVEVVECTICPDCIVDVDDAAIGAGGGQ
jgi:hypothetical protein